MDEKEKLLKQDSLKIQKKNIDIKKLQAHIISQEIEKKELEIKHNQINIKDGWMIKQAEKKIAEARTKFEQKVAEFELKQLKNDIEVGLFGKFDELKLEELKEMLALEEEIIKSLERNITKLNRNHKIESEKK